MLSLDLGLGVYLYIRLSFDFANCWSLLSPKMLTCCNVYLTNNVNLIYCYTVISTKFTIFVYKSMIS